MGEPLQPPSSEDFGLSEEQLAGVRSPFVGSHRPALVVAVVGAGLVTLGVVLWGAGGSLGASLFFAVLLGAASLVLLVPAAFVIVCLSEQAEERWRCATSPLYAAARAYRDAMAAFDARQGEARRRRRRGERGFWTSLAPERLRCELCRLLEADGLRVDRPLERDAAGADWLMRRKGRSIVVRLETAPAGASLGREMVAACLDLGADEALLFCLGQVEPALRNYLEGKPIELVDLDGLVERARRATQG